MESSREKRTVDRVNPEKSSEDPSTDPGSGLDASITDLEVLRAAIRDARSVEGALGELFARLAEKAGRNEASRLWLTVFSESDASET